jgi:penicillin-binding protein 1C
LKRKFKIIVIAAGVLIAPVLLSPLPRFRAPLSTVVEASDGSLLGARIADDGQWRFPALEKVPGKYEKSLLTFEDRWFYYHPGVNPVSIIRAFKNNIKAGSVVSGGSTLTMQVARISRGNKKRTYTEKFIEMLSALKLEMFRSKKKILQLYASNAPFGGNTVGLEAASWRYTGKSSADLTWAEAAALAILPNSPALVFPGKNSNKLKTKRDALLRHLYERRYIDSVTLVLALDEPLPEEPQPLPAKAPHLTEHFFGTNRGEMIKTTIDPVLQERATELLNAHQKDLSGNYIFNSACLIVEVKTGNVLAYVGNSTLEDAQVHGGDVDIIHSSRSTGSILKPILYAAIQKSGDILPNTLIADVPTRFPGFSPKNFDQSFSGAVSAATALSQSLNIPAVKMLQKYNP